MLMSSLDLNMFCRAMITSPIMGEIFWSSKSSSWVLFRLLQYSNSALKAYCLSLSFKNWWISNLDARLWPLSQVRKPMVGCPSPRMVHALHGSQLELLGFKSTQKSDFVYLIALTFFRLNVNIFIYHDV